MKSAVDEKNDFSQLEEKLGYKFRDIKYLSTGLTHSSYANEFRKLNIKCNERQEFLGDAVLSIVVSDYIYRNCPMLPEGELTKLRAALVCEKSLAGYARSIGLGKYLFLSRGERHTNGQDRPSILADAFESVIAAIYLDGGMEEARKFIYNFVVPDIKGGKLIKSKDYRFKDYKTALQEIVQKNPEEKLEYVLVGESGPDHNKHFLVEVHLNSNVIGRGGGKSKKEAEQQAAREALGLMGY